MAVAESLLEFLEEFAVLSPAILERRPLWGSVLGWYAAHYFFYNEANGNIERIRDRWQDRSLYKELHRLFDDYVRTERRQRKLSEVEVRHRIAAAKEHSIEDEKQRYAIVSASAH